MHAVLITGCERLEAREVPEPTVRPGAAVAAIERCGICGTDVAAWRSGDPYPPSSAVTNGSAVSRRWGAA
jgi:threonine dehydrogenase-like Zn-dependent dehydrogenase